MIHLIVGGAAQGKLGYALSLYSMTDGQVTQDSLAGPIVNRLHLQVRAILAAGIDPVAHILSHIQGRELVVLCDEVGCGLVPIQREDREWREAVGRVCCALAEQAAFVDRVVCGIPTRIKGGEGCLKLR